MWCFARLWTKRNLITITYVFIGESYKHNKSFNGCSNSWTTSHQLQQLTLENNWNKSTRSSLIIVYSIGYAKACLLKILNSNYYYLEMFNFVAQKMAWTNSTYSTKCGFHILALNPCKICIFQSSTQVFFAPPWSLASRTNLVETGEITIVRDTGYSNFTVTSALKDQRLS